MLRLVLLLPLLVLANGAVAQAHGPHKPAPETAKSPAAAPIPLPAGWIESRPPAAAGALAPQLAADGDGFLATWIERGGQGEGSQRVRVARFDGKFWTFPATVRESARLFANWADVPGVVRAADGALYVWWLERSGAGAYTYEVRLARSTDQGVTFVPLGVLHDDRSPAEHGFVSAVREGAGLRFFLLDGRATVSDRPMQLRTAFVEGERIAPSELVDESVCDCCATAAVALASGSAVAYRDRTAGEMRDVAVALRPAAGALSTHPVGSDPWKIAGCPVNGPALAVSGRRLAVAWFAAPGDRPRAAVALSDDGGVTWGRSLPIPVTAGATAMGQLGLAATGDAFAVSWLEAIAGGSELRLALLDRSGAFAPAQSLARTGPGRAAGIPRLAAAGQRLGVLWVDSTAAGAGLRFATLAP